LGFNETELKSSKIVWILAFSFILLGSSGSASVYAQDSTDSANVSDWKTFNLDEILTDPIAQKMLENIEISKQILYDIQNPQRIVTPHELYIEQQRMLVQQQLQEELDRMNKNNADKTPRAAFAKYVAKFPEEYHGYLWELFDYLYTKVTIAREARDNILANGGSYRVAQQAFIEHASITKAERIAYAEEMALKYGLINKVSNIDHFNALPDETKTAFVAYMEDKGLGEFASSPMYDDNSLAGSITNVGSEITTQETSSEIITIDYHEVTLEQNSVLDLSYQAPISPTLIELNGHEYATEEIQTMNSVSEFSLSAWVKPDYSNGSSEFTIIGKEKAFTLTINNNKIPEKTVRFSIFDGFKWTIIESSSTIEEEWTHIAAKFDGHVISLYINGNLEAAKQLEGIPTLNSYGFVEPQPIDAIYSESMILYGAHQTTKRGDISTKGFFSGSIDEIVVDDHGFGYNEILDLCNESQYF